MRTPYCFNLVLSSPKDVEQQKKIIEETCDRWNQSSGEEKNVIVEIKEWKKNLNIDSRKKSQDLINDQIVVSCDILFAMFGKRIGTKTDNHQSGTLEEIEIVIKAGKPYFIYFMNQNLTLSESGDSQVQKLRLFKNKLTAFGSFKEIKDENDLKEQFFTDLNYQVNILLKKVEQESGMIKAKTTLDSQEETKLRRNKKNWYELSISDIINDFMQGNNQNFAIYKRGITFIENYSLWKALSTSHTPLLTIAKNAREYAFDFKYGNYNYQIDLRSKYKNWHSEIWNILQRFEFDKNKKETINVIGIASNCGQELKEIFSKDDKNNYHLEVLDLSEQAIKKGKKLYKDIIFTKGDMEESPLQHLNYDIYLNLRSIHSSGVDYKLALADCYRILKPGGIAIISVSNGYLTPKKPNSKELFEIQGLYDNRTESFSKHRPPEFARKIWSKLVDYGFKNAIISTGKTEIFICAQK